MRKSLIAIASLLIVISHSFSQSTIVSTEPSATAPDLMARMGSDRIALSKAVSERSGEEDKLELFYAIHWSEALKFAASSNTNKTIRNAWEDEWQSQPDKTLLIEAVDASGRREFLSDHLISYFLKTDDEVAIQAAADLFVHFGKSEDLSILEEKLKVAKAPKARDIVEAAISWRRFYNHPDGTSGPACLPP